MATAALERARLVEHHRRLRRSLDRVAAGAGHAGVPAVERVAGIAGVVEAAGRAEAVEVVAPRAAGRAGARELSAVGIAVTAGAVERPAVEAQLGRAGARMTAGAVDGGVASGERIAGARVVEAHRAPVALAVAGCAALRVRVAVERAAVGVAVAVLAGHAFEAELAGARRAGAPEGGGEVPGRDLAMAGDAGHGAVRAGERQPCPRMLLGAVARR